MGLIFASAGKAVAQNSGLAGGQPGNTGLEILARNSGIQDLLAQGSIPGTLDELGDNKELGACYAESYLAPGEVLYMHWQGGGGYGDPLRREPESVVVDVRNGKVTPDGAAINYGVVVTDGELDAAATDSKRAALKEERRERSEIPTGQEATRRRSEAELDQTVDLTRARRLDDNLVEVTIGDARVVGCAHCGRLLGDTKTGRLELALYEGPSSAAGPQVTSDPTEYVDTPVVFRQQCCPGCWTAIYSGIVPADHPDHVAELAQLLPAVAGT
jgi:N-methylhydantoinase B